MLSFPIFLIILAGLLAGVQFAIAQECLRRKEDFNGIIRLTTIPGETCPARPLRLHRRRARTHRSLRQWNFPHKRRQHLVRPCELQISAMGARQFER